MNLQCAIDRIFEGKAFTRPLFYSLPGGLRFSLSETGSSIEQFLLALRKAAAISSLKKERLLSAFVFIQELIPSPTAPYYKSFGQPASASQKHGTFGMNRYIGATGLTRT